MLSIVTPSQASQLFALVLAQPQIPFTYPDDGCWARAHEMCRIFISNQVQPGKVWIYGNLGVLTKNSPTCLVAWGYHVAPILQVARDANTTDTVVIDPSMFTAPVAEGTWKGAMQDVNATLVETDASVFQRRSDGTVMFDPNYSLTQADLRDYRRMLLARIAEDGPPPYNCPNVP
jgi:hypothetical protein